MKNRLDSFLFQASQHFDFSIARFLFFASIFWYLESWMAVSSDFGQWFNVSGDVYWQPVSFFKIWSSHENPLPPGVVGPISFLWKISLICCALGFYFRWFAPIAFLTGLLILGLPLNFGKIHHSNHMIVVIMGILAFAKYPGIFSIGQFVNTGLLKKSGYPDSSSEYNWPVKTIWIYMSLVYFAAGFQKLRHSGLEWVFSDNMATIILTRPNVPELGKLVASSEFLCRFFALMTIIVELLFFTALFSKWARLFFVPAAFLMHLSINLIIGVHGNFTPYLFCFIWWVPWRAIFPFRRGKI